MNNLISRFVRDESGATAIEYGLIAALIAVVIITALTSDRHEPDDQVHRDRRPACANRPCRDRITNGRLSKGGRSHFGICT